MRKNKLLALTLVMALSTSMTAFADNIETSSELSEEYMDNYYANAISITKDDNGKVGYTMDTSWLSGVLENNEAFNQMSFTLVEQPTNVTSLNLKFSVLKAEMESNGFGNNFEITLPDSLESSKTALEVFNNNFSDIDFSIPEMSIPDDFNPKQSLDDVKTSINNSYSEFKDTSGFNRIKNAMSLSGIQSRVENALNSTTDLTTLIMSNEERASILSSMSENDSLELEYNTSIQVAKANNLMDTTAMQKNYKDLTESDAYKLSGLDEISNSVTYPIIDNDVINAMMDRVDLMVSIGDSISSYTLDKFGAGLTSDDLIINDSFIKSYNRAIEESEITGSEAALTFCSEYNQIAIAYSNYQLEYLQQNGSMTGCPTQEEYFKNLVKERDGMDDTMQSIYVLFSDEEKAEYQSLSSDEEKAKYLFERKAYLDGDTQ